MNQYIKVHGVWKHETIRVDAETREPYYHYQIVDPQNIPRGARTKDYDAIWAHQARCRDLGISTTTKL